MDPLIARNREALHGLCAAYRVCRLELFGSAARNDHGRASADLDFLVEFEELDPRAYAEAYFGLLDTLTALFDIEQAAALIAEFTRGKTLARHLS